MPLTDDGYKLPTWHSGTAKTEPALASEALISGTTNLLARGHSAVHLFDDDVSGLVRHVSYRTIYETNPWLWAVVQLKARSFSRMPPKVYEQSGDFMLRASSRRGMELEEALRNPGGGLAWQAIQKAAMIDYQIHGNALWAVKTTGRGIESFTSVPWERVSVTRDDNGNRIYRVEPEIEFSGVGEREDLDPLDVIHFGYGENPANLWRNTSPIGSLQATLALFDAVYQQVLNYFHNGARPSGHFSIDPDTSPEMLAAIAVQIRESISGTKNAGKVMITPGKYEALSGDVEQSKVIELGKQSREEICGVFGVAPPLVGILDRAIFSNVKELRNFTMRDTVGPDVEMMAGQLGAQISYKRPMYRGALIDFESAAQLKPDLEAISETIPNQLRIRTPNEMREKFNLRPLDDEAADKLWNPNKDNKEGEEGKDGEKKKDAKGKSGGTKNAGELTERQEKLAAATVALQKVYLAVDKVLTAEEARALITEMGYALPGDLPETEPEPEPKIEPEPEEGDDNE